MKCAAVLVLLTAGMIGRLAFAQNPPALLVVPSKAIMLVGDTRTFRAVGKDGRKQQNVAWSVSPENAARLTTADDEATLQATEPSATVVLTARAGDDSAEASIEIRSGTTAMAVGTALWSVTSLPGCKTAKMSQAVPTANGPDLYVEEACPDGTYVRAMTADGREIWRRRLGDLAVRLRPGLTTKEKTQPAERLNMSARSLCDDVFPGMTKDAVSKLAQDRNLPLGDKERESGSWMIEEEHFHCRIVFNTTGTVMKKTKIIITD